MSEDNKITPDTKISPIKLGDHFKLLQHAHNTHCAIIDQYMSVAQLENPQFWAFVAPNLKTMDRLQVTAKDGSMLAFGLVKFAKGSIVKIQFYEHYDLDVVAQQEVKVNGFTIRQISITAGWEIIDELGNPLKDEGLPDQNSAMIYLNDHMKHETSKVA